MIITKKTLLSLLLCAGLFTGTQTVAVAKTKDKPVAKEAILSVKYEDLESVGLYRSTRQGSLGRDLWNGSTRSALSYLLENTPTQSTSRTLNILNKRLLLSAANSSLLKDDIEIEAGKDLLTLRFNRLLDIGHYKEAFEQYSLFNVEPYHDNLARAGVLSMLYNKERALACLEANTIKDRFPDVSFWQDLRNYCGYTMPEKPSKKALKALKKSDRKLLHKIASKKKYRFAYSSSAFKKLSRLEQSILIAEDRLDLRNVDLSNLNAISARHIPLLLSHKNLSTKNQFTLTAYAIKLGFLQPSALIKLYEENAPTLEKPDELEDAAQEAALENAEEQLASWQKPAYFYVKLSDTSKNEERWEILRKALALEGELSVEALSPFAKMLSNITPDGANLKEIKTALRIMHLSDITFPKKWKVSLQKTEENQESHSKAYESLSFALYISKANHKKSSQETAEIKAFLDGDVDKTTLFRKNIIENLDNRRETMNNAAKVYDKAYDLTLAFDYVMPTVDVMDRLALSSKKGSISETALLSTSVLRNSHLQNLYPGVVRDILNSFNAVGLINISKDLVIEAILAD